MFERLKRKSQLKKIKERLSDQFKNVSLQHSFPEIDSIRNEYGINDIRIQAKIDSENQIHLVVKYNSSELYHAVTTNYQWFLENVNF